VAVRQAGGQQAVGKRFEQLDCNGDAKVTPDELPAAAIFWRIDLDGDGAITKPEADVVLLDRPVAVKATGVMPYQTVIVETHMPEDRWVQAIEVQPGDRNVVHHALRRSPVNGTSATVSRLTSDS
jgi:hypothetical protein